MYTYARRETQCDHSVPRRERLFDTARNYTRAAASENALNAYAKDWADFTRWFRIKCTAPLPSSPVMIGLYRADLASPTGKAPSQSVPLRSIAAKRCRVQKALWGDEFDGWKIGLIPANIACKQRKLVNCSMRADEKIG